MKEPKFLEVDRPRSDARPDGRVADKWERVRYPKPKDRLLAVNPPWMPSAAILLIAALLVAAVMATRNIEYQETVPISLVLKEGEISGSAYGVGMLPQSLAAKVRPDQPTLIELGPSADADNAPIEGRVSQVVMTCQDSLYQVRVDLPANFNSYPEKARILRQEVRAQGRIVIRRGELFRRVFTLFGIVKESTNVLARFPLWHTSSL